MGLGITKSYAKEGAKLSLNIYRMDSEEIDSLINELKNINNTKVIVTKGDTTDENTEKELIDKTIATFGKIVILVNNAGMVCESPVQDMTSEIWNKMINIDLSSAFLTTRSVAPHMISRKSGRIINITYQTAQIGTLNMSHYAAAKAVVIGFAKSIALELGQYGITANCVAPSPTEAELFDSVSGNFKNNKKADLALPHFAKVEEVAASAVFLAADPDGNAYTGQTLGPNSENVMFS
ncbi:SDR family NAD(P)-dependent oxidoreductase [Staphylococcus shinii]|uniref:SDR family NAD(P)-dependent oxidoreductase n=1 Tax=Staphylococcus shinii TaxID=2912228 RepID=UPI0023AEA84B|nr:SDR family oxidoreductase [Staphylococcus shinii]